MPRTSTPTSRPRRSGRSSRRERRDGIRAEIRPGRDLPNLDFEEVYYGPEGFVQFLARINEAWEDPRWEPEEYIEAGDDVVVFIRMTMTGRGSGIPMEQHIGHVCTMRAGKLIRHVTYWDRARALEAVGLAEDADG